MVTLKFKYDGKIIKRECVIYKPEAINNYSAVIILPESKNSKLNFYMGNKIQEQSKLNLKVLYVEDKLINQQVLSVMLEDKGCKVDLANNGQEGVEKANKKSYDLIFMDINMPVMDGLTASKKINNNNNNNSPPIIAITAYYDIIDESELENNGIVDVIAKPFNSKQVFEKIYYWAQEK